MWLSQLGGSQTLLSKISSEWRANLINCPSVFLLWVMAWCCTLSPLGLAGQAVNVLLPQSAVTMRWWNKGIKAACLAAAAGLCSVSLSFVLAGKTSLSLSLFCRRNPHLHTCVAAKFPGLLHGYHHYRLWHSFDHCLSMVCTEF